MREKKFRFAFATQNEKNFVAFGFRTLEELLYGSFENEAMNEQIAPFTDLEDAVELDIIGSDAFTGLKDKNGVEIYESDIIQIYKHSDITNKHEKQTRLQFKSKKDEIGTYVYIGDINDVRQVKFIYGALCLWGNNGSSGIITYFDNLWRPGQSIEVIGNIYKNKEIL